MYRIGIYARGLSEQTGGVKEYIEKLTKALIEILPSNYELYIIHNLSDDYFRSRKKNVQEIKLSAKSKLISDFIKAPLMIRSLQLNSVVFPKNIIPFFLGKKVKKIVVIHDLAYFLPQYNAYPLIDALHMKLMIRSSCERADEIIAISNNTKKDLSEILKVDRAKVIYEGVGEEYRTIDDKNALNRIKKKYSLNNNFILYTGNISPRKNLTRTIEAFNKISDKIGMDLVLTGNRIWGGAREMKLIKKNKKIKLLGQVSKEDIVALYNLAKVYIYPSLYEGFGLPVLEAQACGCPVILSHSSSLPEVGGDSVYYVNPYEEDDIAQAISRLALDKDLTERLVSKGYENIKRFSWYSSAKELLSIISQQL